MGRGHGGQAGHLAASCVIVTAQQMLNASGGTPFIVAIGNSPLLLWSLIHDPLRSKAVPEALPWHVQSEAIGMPSQPWHGILVHPHMMYLYLLHLVMTTIHHNLKQNIMDVASYIMFLAWLNILAPCSRNDMLSQAWKVPQFWQQLGMPMAATTKVRLTNKRLPKQSHADVAKWIEEGTGQIFWVSKSMTVDESLITIAHKLGVPQRCIAITGYFKCYRFFATVNFQGAVAPACYPANSRLWEQHCNVCDDKVHAKLRGECKECGVDSCDACLMDGICFLCRSGAKNWHPCCLRDEFLDEAYERLTWDEQPEDHALFTFFPFQPVYGPQKDPGFHKTRVIILKKSKLKPKLEFGFLAVHLYPILEEGGSDDGAWHQPKHEHKPTFAPGHLVPGPLALLDGVFDDGEWHLVDLETCPTAPNTQEASDSEWELVPTSMTLPTICGEE